MTVFRERFPKCTPSRTAFRICNLHFDADEIVSTYDKRGRKLIGLKDDVVPKYFEDKM